MRLCFKLYVLQHYTICLLIFHRLHYTHVTMMCLSYFWQKSLLELIKNRRVAGNVTPFEKWTNTRKTQNHVTKSKIIYFSVLFQMVLLLSLGTKVRERHTLVLNWINLYLGKYMQTYFAIWVGRDTFRQPQGRGEGKWTHSSPSQERLVIWYRFILFSILYLWKMNVISDIFVCHIAISKYFG